MFAEASFHHIPYSIPSEIFHLPENRDALRKNYGVGNDQLMWVFGSDELDYFRKGADILLEAFSGWKNDRVRLIIAGEQGKQTVPDDPRIQFTGHIREQNTMSELLGAADALVHTSREDNFPNIILESFFCGTPVLATPAGGVPEMITTANGILTENFSPESLRSSFDVLLATHFNREEISASALVKYAASVQAKKMIEVYKSV
jgi:glycosyltransferase involved in cell wall biosynthesis